MSVQLSLSALSREEQMVAPLRDPSQGPPLSRGLLFRSISSAIGKKNQEHLFMLSWDTAKGGGPLEASTSVPQSR